MKSRLNDIVAHHTGQPLAVIEQKLERDHFLSAEEARLFGIVDAVVQHREKKGQS